MQISILLMKQILELFLMIFMGYVIVKTGLLKDKDSKVISKIVFDHPMCDYQCISGGVYR